jgi:hypothetical protein
MRWTREQFNEYANRRKSQSPKPQPAVLNEPVAAPQGKGSDPSRVHVRVTSHRKRLCDPDNLCPKYFIDCLRYAGLIRDDNPNEITLEVRQEKSKRDFTVIEITKEAIT